MDALQEATTRLRELGAQPPTPARRAEVVAALGSKFEGVQVVAAGVLAGWGGPDSASAIKAWLLRLYERPYGWAARTAAARALARCLGPGDAEWALELYFTLTDQLLKHELLPLVAALPPEAARARIVRESASDDWMNRQAALKAIARIPFADRRGLLRPFLGDEIPAIRSAARHLLEAEA